MLLLLFNNSGDGVPGPDPVNGPLFFKGMVYHPGMQEAQLYQPGLQKAEVFQPGLQEEP